MLTQLSVKNYKSIESLDLKLGPLTVFIGPNNAGKTNILDVFRIISSRLDAFESGSPNPLPTKDFLFHGAQSNVIEIALDGNLDDSKQEYFEYKIGIRDNSGFLTFAGPETLYEYLADTKAPVRIFRFDTRDWQINLDVPGQEASNLSQINIAQNSPGLGQVVRHLSGLHLDASIKAKFKSAVYLDTLFRNYALFNLDPSRMRDRKKVHAQTKLQELGENLAEVVHTIHAKHRRPHFDLIERYLTAIVPEITELISDLEKNETFIAVKEPESEIAIPSFSLPDGVLKLIGVLTVLNSPGKPPLIAIEEPENFIHPHAQNMLAEHLINYSKKHQLMLTTHSPTFLSNFPLESVVVVERKEGRTVVHRPADEKDLKKRLNEAGLSLGDAWYAGHLGGVN